MRLGILPAEVVRIIGGDHADAQLLAQLEHSGIHLDLFRNAVLLNLEPEAVRSEASWRTIRRRPLGLLVVALPQVERDLTRQTRGESDQTLGMFGQDFLVDPRAAVEPLEETDGAQSNQVPVAGAVLGEQNQVAVQPGRALRLLLQFPGTECEVRLEAEDGTDAFRLGMIVERPGRVQVAVIRHGQAIHSEALYMINQLGNPVGAVEEGVLGVGVEMNESHGISLSAIPDRDPAAPLARPARIADVPANSYFSRSWSSFNTASSGTPRDCRSTSR